MADNAYNTGLGGLLAKIASSMRSFGLALQSTYFFSRESICGTSREESRIFFDRDDATGDFTKEFVDGLKSGSNQRVVDVETKLHFIASLEQEHNARYNCSRRHALCTAANNAVRLGKDIELIYKVKGQSKNEQDS